MDEIIVNFQDAIGFEHFTVSTTNELSAFTSHVSVETVSHNGTEVTNIEPSRFGVYAEFATYGDYLSYRSGLFWVYCPPKRDKQGREIAAALLRYARQQRDVRLAGIRAQVFAYRLADADAGLLDTSSSAGKLRTARQFEGGEDE